MFKSSVSNLVLSESEFLKVAFFCNLSTSQRKYSASNDAGDVESAIIKKKKDVTGIYRHL